MAEFLQIAMSFVTGSTTNLYLIVCAHHAFPIITFEELNVSYATHSHRRLAPLPGYPSSKITYFPSPNCPHTSVCRGTLFCMKVKAALCARFCCMGRRLFSVSGSLTSPSLLPHSRLHPPCTFTPGSFTALSHALSARLYWGNLCRQLFLWRWDPFKTKWLLYGLAYRAANSGRFYIRKKLCQVIKVYN